jgi:hypothetical protein
MKPPRVLTRLACAFLLISLTSCDHSNEVQAPQLPEPKQALKDCVAEPVPALPGQPGTGFSEGETPGIIGDQRKSALAKDRCAHNYNDWYLDLRKSLAH